MKRRKVLFFITAMGHGSGGHFHSLNHISTALSRRVDSKIITLGKGSSPILMKNPLFDCHIDYNSNNFLEARRLINNQIKKYKPDIIHCFDLGSFEMICLSIYPQKIPIIVNKCGGPNVLRYPKVGTLVLFSKENLDWFKANKKFKKTKIFQIPNRINKDELTLEENKEYLKDASKFNFVRIARIGKSYKKSLVDSIHLIRKINNNNKNRYYAHLYIIGTVEDEKIFLELKEISKNLLVTFIIDDKFTQKASKMLYLADAVIATGRGVMEATAFGKPILTPAENAELPILVNQGNFDRFFSTNFSERNLASETDLQESFKNVEKMIIDSSYYESLSHFSSEKFKIHFDVENGIDHYMNVYENTLKNRVKSNFLLHNPRLAIGTVYNCFIK